MLSKGIWMARDNMMHKKKKKKKEKSSGLALNYSSVTLLMM